MLSLYFGDWTNWAPYDPSNGYLGPQKVTFDGINKLILVNEGVTSLDFRTDVYSAWKEWLLDPNHVNSKYQTAISVIGGDPLPGARALGTTYFIENGWRMRTWNGDHSLTVIGNVYTREGAPIFIPTTERVTTTIELVNSTLPETLLPTTSLSNTDVSTVASAVWDANLSQFVVIGTAGKTLADSKTASEYAANTVDVINNNTSNIATPPSANEIANSVWSSNTGMQIANNTTRLIKLAEADEELTSNTATKRDKDTGDVLLVKNVSGVPNSNTSINITSP